MIYGRQSRTKERSESLATQEQVGRETCERFGVEIVAVLLEPPSTSGYKRRGRTRPKFLALLDLIESGDVNTVVASRLDRLSRGGGPGWAPLLEAAESAGLDVDRFVLTPSGYASEFEIGIRATMDREESKKRSDQLQDMKERHASEGRPWGGGARPFGYVLTDGNLEVVPDEAEMIREAAKRLLAGEALAGICRDWNAEGLRTALGKDWRAGTLRNVLRRGSLAALREHRGEVVGPGLWEPILDRPTWDAVQTILTDPTRQHAPSGRENLLTGLARCHSCGAKLVTAPVQGRMAYRCPSKAPGRPGNGCLSIVGEPFEAVVVEAALQRLESPDFAAALAGHAAEHAPEDEGGAEEVAALEARLAETIDGFASGEIPRAVYLQTVKAIEARLEDARGRLARRSRVAAVEGLEAGARDAWPTMTPSRRKALLAAVIDRIEVGPARRGLNRFDPSRISVEWRF